MSDAKTVAALQRNLADAEVERLRLVERVKELEEPRLRSLHIENGAIEMSIEEGAKLILSGGLVYPEYPRPAAPAVSGR